MSSSSAPNPVTSGSTPTLPVPSNTHADKEDFRMYHQLQYERISQHEQQRLTVTNVVLGFSILSFTIGFNDLSQLNPVNGVGLPAVIIAANIFSIMYAQRSKFFINMHQSRAKTARDWFAPELNTINASVAKIDSSKDPFNRIRLQQYLHCCFLLIAVATIALYIIRPETATNPLPQTSPQPSTTTLAFEGLDHSIRDRGGDPS